MKFIRKSSNGQDEILTGIIYIRRALHVSPFAAALIPHSSPTAREFQKIKSLGLNHFLKIKDYRYKRAEFLGFYHI